MGDEAGLSPDTLLGPSVHLTIDFVHLIIGPDDFVGQRRIEVHQRIETLVQHRLGLLRHPGEIVRHIDLLLAYEEPDAFGDIDRGVSDTFEFGIDFQHGDDESKVVGHGLVKRQNLLAFFLDIDFRLVYFVVGLDDGPGQLRITLAQRRNGLTYCFFNKCTETQDLLFQLPGLVLKVFGRGTYPPNSRGACVIRSARIRNLPFVGRSGSRRYAPLGQTPPVRRAA